MATTPTSVISTFVFFDLEATGLQKTNPKITELSFVAVRRHGLTDTPKTKAPRVMEKLSLCFCPMKSVGTSSDVTGISYSDN